MRNVLKSIGGAFTKFLFSDLCALCKKRCHDNGDGICGDCRKRFGFITEPFCVKCGKPFMNNEDISHTCGVCIKNDWKYAKARSVFVYDDIIKNAIIDYKFFRNITHAKLFSKYFCDYIEKSLNNDYDMIMPVPLHKKRLRERHFNQALMLLDSIKNSNQIKVDKYSLKRIKYTTPQVFLKGSERVKNVKGAFLVTNTSNISNKRILIVDDIYTTGSTVNECSNVLKRAGAKKVDVLTLAKTIFNR